jgi:predicted esterase
MNFAAPVLVLCLGFAATGLRAAHAIPQLQQWLAIPRETRPAISNAPFATAPLTRAEADEAARLLWEDHAAFIRATREAELKAGVIEINGKRMPFEIVSFGDTNAIPQGGRSLFISMHGGGGAPKAVNDSQWKNQVRLGKGYAPKEGLYVAPRAPTDNWNLWHEPHIDRLFDRLIEDLVVLRGVNPDRVYIMGYSAGGDGVYQLAPRMSDRWAAAAMMAGHPNETSPAGLRNVPFAIQVGANDGGFKRNSVAADFGRKLDELQRGDTNGYLHFTELHAGKGHWMDMQDRKAVPWMEKFTRDPLPARIVWRQDDVTHDRLYWLAVPTGAAKNKQEIIAERSGTLFAIEKSDATNILVRLNDAMTDLDKPVTIRGGSKELFAGRVTRTVAVIEKTLRERGDRRLLFSAEVAVKLAHN